MEETKRAVYEAPATLVVEVRSESIICASAEGREPWEVTDSKLWSVEDGNLWDLE